MARGHPLPVGAISPLGATKFVTPGLVLLCDGRLGVTELAEWSIGGLTPTPGKGNAAEEVRQYNPRLRY